MPVALFMLPALGVSPVWQPVRAYPPGLFWRWASRKVFEPVPGQAAGGGRGVVAFITAAGFLSGPGFVRMRQELRRWCHEVWVIDCSPEGHQPEVATRIFQGVQQPVCIVIGVRQRDKAKAELARVRWRALPEGRREAKFEALAALRLDQAGWQECPAESKAPFLPESVGAWATYPTIEDLFGYNGSGVMPGRTWVIAPDEASLRDRWRRLIDAAAHDKERLFHPHLRNGEPGDKHARKVVDKGLGTRQVPKVAIADETNREPTLVRYGFRTLDRQWLVADPRVLNQPNPQLWQRHSDAQVYLTFWTQKAPNSGPALTLTGYVPDLDYYRGSFGGRVFPLWADAEAKLSNIPKQVCLRLADRLAQPCTPQDLFAYVASLTAHPGYIERFRNDLSTPGLRIPLTADPALFAEAVALGRRVIWLHTFGERFADAAEGREPGPPRLPPERRPRVPKEGTIPTDAEHMPDTIDYDAAKQRLLVGRGFIEPVTPAVWQYEVSGKQVLVQWFSYRKKNRERPMIGDRRPPSPLGDIQPDTWLAEYTTELLNVLNVLGLLVELEPAQADLLRRICEGPTIPASALPLGPAAGHHSAVAEVAEKPQADLDFGNA